ncbi:MAG: hypothetical protein V7754_00085 [Halioglobus sp.]
MIYKMMTIAAFVLSSLIFTQVSSADVVATESAKIVVYRADESMSTRRVGMNLHGSAQSLGRLNANDSVVITQPAGAFTLVSSIRGASPLVMDLKPGKTYYVHTEMDMSGNKVMVHFAEVEEHVAKVQQPMLETTI